LYGKEGYALVDIMTGENEPPPKVFSSLSVTRIYYMVQNRHIFLSHD